MFATRYITCAGRSDNDIYHILKIDVGGRREVEVTVSPAGRRIHIHVDGVRYEPAGT